MGNGEWEQTLNRSPAQEQAETNLTPTLPPSLGEDLACDSQEISCLVNTYHVQSSQLRNTRKAKGSEVQRNEAICPGVLSRGPKPSVVFSPPRKPSSLRTQRAVFSKTTVHRETTSSAAGTVWACAVRGAVYLTPSVFFSDG